MNVSWQLVVCLCVPYVLYVTTRACVCDSCAQSETLLGSWGEFGASGCCFVRMINDQTLERSSVKPCSLGA